VRSEAVDLSRWWEVFNDPALDHLMLCAYQQNLSLKELAFKVLQFRYQLAIAKGNLFPQTQTANGQALRLATSAPPPGAANFGSSWAANFNLQWELDFWGRFRRTVRADEASLEGVVDEYDGQGGSTSATTATTAAGRAITSTTFTASSVIGLVTLFADVANEYMIIRTDQEAIRSLRENVKIQKELVLYTKRRFDAGFRETELDLDQARAIQEATEAQISPLERDIRQASDLLCLYLGIPPCDLTKIIGGAPIPTVPPEVAIGIPADLLRRRPDIRQAERAVAAQAEQIGIAEADLYPAIFVNGTVGYQSQELSTLFTPSAFTASTGPSFQWNVLNYGRIANNTKAQDAALQQLILNYQYVVLQANGQVEDGLATFLHAQDQTKLLAASVKDYQGALNIVLAQEKVGAVDYSRYATIATALVQQQLLLAQAQGLIAQGLVDVYRALGGGWEFRCRPDADAPAANEPSGLKMIEEVPAPLPKQLDSNGEQPKPPVAEPDALPVTPSKGKGVPKEIPAPPTPAASGSPAEKGTT
jgi:outer membrane protein TolC